MLYLCPDRWLFVFAPLDLSFGTGRLVLALGRPAVGFIFDLFSLGISGDGVILLLSAKISAVSINGIFLTS